jgi:hypothetical protein
VAFSEDLTAFFDTDGFAVSATVGGGTVVGIFDHAYVDVYGVSGERPVFICATASVSSVAVGDALTVNSQAYAVRAKQADGTGITRMILEETA